METKLLHAEITEKIINCFFTVNKTLPYGLSTEIYRNALTIEFEYNSLNVERNYSIELKYRNKKISVFNADFLINDKVLVLVICIEKIDRQTEEYSKLLMRESKYEVCIVINTFGDTEYKRYIFTNNYKKNK